MSNWVATTKLRWRRPKYKTRYSTPGLEQLWVDGNEQEWRPVEQLWVGVALDAILKNGCDCEDNDLGTTPTCERALRTQWDHLHAEREVRRRLREQLTNHLVAAQSDMSAYPENKVAIRQRCEELTRALAELTKLERELLGKEK
jgi:hypothetical protein